MLEETVHLEAGSGSEHIFCFRADIFDESCGNDAQCNLTVDAAEGEVVDLISERWDIGTFGGIDLNGQHVVGVKLEMRRQVERERRVSAFVLPQASSIEPNGRGRHYSFEIDENMPAARFSGKPEMTAIDGNKFVVFVVKAVPGHTNIGVRNHHPLELGIVKILCARLVHRGAAEQPVTAHRKDKSPAGYGHRRRTGRLRKCALCQDSGYQRAGFFHELSSFHDCDRPTSNFG